MELSPEDEQQIIQNLSSKDWRMSNLYFIKDKQGREVLFELNRVQKEYRDKKHNRNIILKARQQGFTTYECINALDECLFNANFDAGIIAHTVDDAEKIFTNKVKFAFDRLPEIIKTVLRPSNDRAGELRFPNGSSISVSAGFRGGTLRKLHVSEYGKICAKFPDKAIEIKTGAFNAVPLDGDLTIESTAEGMTGDFFDMCEVAQGNDGQHTPLDFRFHFFPWFESDEYRLNPEGIELSSEHLSYFKMLKDDHGINLDESQKAWYVKKALEQDDGMKQEYPSFSIESFRASGRPVFNLEKISRDLKRAKDIKPIKGVVTANGFTELPNGPVIIFKQPVKGEAYAIGADVAEGLENGDFSTASVLNKNFEQVAVYHGHIDPDKFGGFLVNLAKYYNDALLAPEQNNHGHATLAAIKNQQYYLIYKREVYEELGKDIQEKVGWLTNMKTKMLMLDDLKAVYRDDSLKVNDEQTLREMMTLTIEDNGDTILNSKDRVVALAIGIQAIKQLPTTKLGTFESNTGKTKFKNLQEMLKHNGDKDQESYFD